MAKRKAAKRSLSIVQAFSKKVRTAIEAIRKPFNAFAEDLKLVNESRAELAPKFMKAFGLWQAEIGGTFVDFCRVLAPDIGPSRAEYRIHPAYQAADYLRRLAQQTERAGNTPEQQAQRVKDAANAPVPPTMVVARLIRVITGIVQPEAQAALWAAFRDQLHWPDRTVQRIRTESQNVEPLVVVGQPRGMHAIGNLRLAVPEMPVEEPRAAAAG